MHMRISSPQAPSQLQAPRRWRTGADQTQGAPARLRSTTALGNVLIPLGGTVVAAGTVLSLGLAHANPTGGKVVGGSATITATSPTRLDVHQKSDKAIINWQDFSIGKGEHTNFRQPGPDAITLNRVVGEDPSKIMGRLSANGHVWLVNPHGVLFGPSAQVDVAGLVATTADISNRDFMAGRYRFDKPGDLGAVVANAGNITVREAGLGALVAPGVENSGVIRAHLGHVQLASANGFALDFYGDGKFNFMLTEPAVAQSTFGESPSSAAAVENTGSIVADGGSILLTANAAKSVVDNVINTDGYIRAQSVDIAEGKIVLHGGPNGRVTVAGTLDATGADTGEKGGNIAVLGDQVKIDESAQVDASGHSGGGEILVGGNFQGKGPEQNATATTIKTGAELRADAEATGNGGMVIAWADGATDFAGSISAQGGYSAGDGGFVEVSGKERLRFEGAVALGAPTGSSGTLLLDPRQVRIVANGADDDEIRDGDISIGDDPGSDYTISAEALSNVTGDIRIAATDEVVIESDIDLGTRSLDVTAGSSIELDAIVSASHQPSAVGIELRFRAPQFTQTSSGRIDASRAPFDNGQGQIFGTDVYITANEVELGGEPGSIASSSIHIGPFSSAQGVSVGIGDGAIGRLSLTSREFERLAPSSHGSLSFFTTGPMELGDLNIDNESFNHFSGETIDVVENSTIRTTGLQLQLQSGSLFSQGAGSTISAIVSKGQAILDIRAADISLEGDPGSIRGQGSLSFLSRGPSKSVAIGDGVAGDFHLSAREVGVFADGFRNISFSHSGQNHVPAEVMRIGDVAFSDPVFFRSFSVFELAQGRTLQLHGGASLEVVSDTQNGVFIQQPGSRIAGIGGRVAIAASDVEFNGGPGSISGSGRVILEPVSRDATIGIGNGSTGDFKIEAAEIAALRNGFSSITIGREDGRHDIDVQQVGFSDPVTIQTPEGGSINVRGRLLGADNASITLVGAGSRRPPIIGELTTFLEADILTTGNPVTIRDDVIVRKAAKVDTTLNGAARGADVTFEDIVNGAGSGGQGLTVHAGRGNVNFLDAVGTTVPLGSFSVQAHDLATAATFAAGQTRFEASGDISGAVEVASLSIVGQSAVLTGQVGGQGGQAAANAVVLESGHGPGPFTMNGFTINAANRPPVTPQPPVTPPVTPPVKPPLLPPTEPPPEVSEPPELTPVPVALNPLYKIPSEFHRDSLRPNSTPPYIKQREPLFERNILDVAAILDMAGNPNPLLSLSSNELRAIRRVADSYRYARLSEAIYANEAMVTIGNQTWRLQETFSDELSGFAAGIYRSSEGGTVLVFRGTEGLSDWLTNLYGLVIPTPQHLNALELAERAVERYGNDLVVTGHSLGGSLAQSIGALLDLRTVTFNTSSVPPSMQNIIDDINPGAGSTVLNISLIDDPVGRVSLAGDYGENITLRSDLGEMPWFDTIIAQSAHGKAEVTRVVGYIQTAYGMIVGSPQS